MKIGILKNSCKIARRRLLANALKGLATLAAVTAGPVSLVKAADLMNTDVDATRKLHPLADALRKIGSERCLEVARQLETSLQTSADITLHLRGAEIDAAGARLIASAMGQLSEEQAARLVSFSLSYNTDLKDAGIVAIAQALPSSVRELGFVGCGFGDRGAEALLALVARSKGMRMICIENNPISDAVKARFRDTARSEPRFSLSI